MVLSTLLAFRMDWEVMARELDHVLNKADLMQGGTATFPPVVNLLEGVSVIWRKEQRSFCKQTRPENPSCHRLCDNNDCAMC